MVPFYASPRDEQLAIRRAAARSGCKLRRVRHEPARVVVGSDGASALDEAGGALSVVSRISCKDGWQAARLLLALAIEDSRTKGAADLARQLRALAPSDEAFARAIQSFVQTHIRFVRENGELFQSGGMTLARGVGDCDDHFRLAYAIGRAGGLDGALGILHHGVDAMPVSRRGPAHAGSVFCLADGCVWAETTVSAHFGEEPNAAARRLGLTKERDDIAAEVVMLKEEDLPPLPENFRSRNNPAQVLLDCEALQRLGDYPAASALVCDPTAPALRLAVMRFQKRSGIVADGLLGPATRLTLARKLSVAGVEGFGYPGMGSLGEPAGASGHLTDRYLLMVKAMADRFREQGATAAAEDFLQVWTFESGINSHQQTNVVDPRTGLRYGNAGINQMGETERRNTGFPPDSLAAWLALSNEEQHTFVERFYQSAARMGGGARAFRDAGSVYVATFAPAFLSHSGEPDFPLYRAPSKEYAANRGLDRAKKGYISVADMGAALETASRSPVFLEARARIRALGAAPATPPGGIGAGGVVGVALLVGIAGAVAAHVKGWL